MLSFGTYRHLSQCSDRRGVFVVLAIDHRDNLAADLQKHSPQPIGHAEVAAFKRSVIRHLAGAASAVLADPDYGFPALLDGALPGDKALLAPLEVTDYRPHPSQRPLRFIPDWNVARIKQAGCSGVKLLIYFHPEAPNAHSLTETVEQIVEQCRAQCIPLFLEPIVYSLDPSRDLTSPERRGLVVETARHFSQRGVDVLKLEFPVDVAQEPDETVQRAALDELNAACAVPWTLLSAGVPFATFLRQATLACAAGASGVIAGRAVWAEAVALSGEARERFLGVVGAERMARLAAVCHALGAPWTQKHAAPQIGERWYAPEKP